MLHYTITIHLVRYNIIVYYAILHHTLYCPVKFFKNRRLCVIIFLGTLAGRERERRGRGMERGRGKGDGVMGERKMGKGGWGENWAHAQHVWPQN